MGDKISYESIYNGGISSFQEDYGKSVAQGEFFTGYQGVAGTTYMGFPGSPGTANQLGETINAIKQGVKSFEISMLSANSNGQPAETIPKQHFDEMRALMKLTGVKPSVHGPIDLDPSGFSGQRGYDEREREENERRFFFAMQQAAKLKDEGNINVVFHSSVGLPGANLSPGDIEKGEDRFLVKTMPVVNRETGQIDMIKEDKNFDFDRPEDFDKGGSVLSLKNEDEIKKRFRATNYNQWEKQLLALNTYKKEADEIQRELVTSPAFAKYADLESSGKLNKETIEKLSKENPEIIGAINEIGVRSQRLSGFLQNNRLAFQGAFNLAYEYGTKKQREELKSLAEEMKEEFNEEKFKGTLGREMGYSMMLDKGISKLIEITSPRAKDKSGTPDEDFGPPKLIVPLEEFAREKAATTFGNLAWRGYKELGGEKAPVVSVENMFAGEWVHSTAESLEKLIKESRKKFVENAVSEKKMDKKQAEKVAEKLIGVTWDVGHLNMMKKSGFTDEDVVKATKKIAPYVKHVHLTDNFGYSDSHLAPGMGNVPIKKILEELEKTGRLGEMSKIVESGGFVQHFKKSPHAMTLAALGSPIYGAKMGPYWNQVSAFASGGGYAAGPLSYLPEKHFSTYGSGFSSLPIEVGGQMPGSSSRFSGTANA